MELSAQGSLATHESLKAFLNSVTSRGVNSLGDQAVTYLAKKISKILYGFMMKNTNDIDIDQPLVLLDVDGLVGIELRNWLH